ncbi:hypothetical protein [Amycolatopsis pithecellobii]|uniref:Uncharacterized protein n=1 Tax=Amycolatopsis pithecellobii TaxID=664692 RepID=A0A6N7Z960_9PSEU|nr:hypothetical protein [Amycolatopsis pithecellobii]MTD58166.1 hypothetical protein [Amycolatopsis pithecellobii]
MRGSDHERGVQGWHESAPRAQAREVEKASVPPEDLLDRTITRRDVQQYDVYFIWGPGRDIASRTDCGHGYYLTDSCPCCDAEDDN